MLVQAGDVAVVTGGASGIGRALAEAFHERGVSVVLVDVEAEALDETVAALARDRAPVAGLPCDVSDRAALQHAAERTRERFGRVDILCNNAGVGGGVGPAWHLHAHDWTWTLGVNVLGVANGLAAFLPAMIDAGRGHVVNVASLAGLTGPPFMAAYVASKHAVVGLSEALEAELRILGAPIGVTVVCPGWVRTGIFESGRNRPDALRHDTPLAPDLLVPVAEAFGDVLTTSIAPDDVAARVLEAIERDRFYAFTHPAQAPAVRERLRRIDAALDADAG